MMAMMIKKRGGDRRRIPQDCDVVKASAVRTVREEIKWKTMEP